MCDDPQVVQQKVTQKIHTPEGLAVGLITQPVQLDRTPASIATTAPAWGEHTEEMLDEAGYSTDEIADLKKRGVV
jgi:crotonobetainyl-CoA:carnitine CoA-transferase CaiB-like acyl-CoA transferase